MNLIARHHRGLIALTGAVALGIAGPAFAQPATKRAAPPNPADVLAAPAKPAGVKGRFSVVSVGDLLLARPQSATPDPEMHKVLDLIRTGDVAIANQEGMAFDLTTFGGTAYGPGGVLAQPGMAKDYKAMGLAMVSVANNHSTDWGWEGLLASLKLLDEAGVIHAGGGRNLTEARGAGFYATPKGRVGLVATASTFKVNAAANDPANGVNGRAGISVLKTRTINLVTADQLAALKRVATERASPLHPAPDPDAREFTFGDQIYRLSPTPGLHYDMDLYDHAGLLTAVREAKAQSDLVVFHIHAHESPTGVDDDTPEPPDFLVTLFHNCVDAGADVIMGGGPHSLRGVEIYKGKPIFYGLGLFFFKPTLMGTPENMFRKFPDTGYRPEPDPRPHNPAGWYDSVLAITDFDGPKVKQVRLYPIDLANTAPAGSRGLPHLATGDRAREILARLQSDSALFGTKIAIEGDIGLIRVP
jgi:poly-gamma-glutamate capsule biosynthesis protein CapA/YwtB (metallophosphatase superfamily)